ncbi:hypothetical protein [Aquimarina muelleri]|uniref:Lipoprotein n=1 Tax=Aquimarina muelleri TaxID=279356 RepID=A0A918JZ47_9FLAO|nr:hypothetical protein [Aquimarina muelleri]MCX2764464.1 hypothetical protein [Aquimarina muelleri]GGX32662.1 hypothetical protein GCM10007384_36830 [Aquimarina muelleri]
MNKFIYHILISTLIVSCSEGDIINNDITNFDAPLENCANLNKNTFVFFKVDKTTNSTISMSFNSSTFNIRPNTSDISTTEPTTIALNGDTNQLIYREFSSNISGSDYFCSIVPPNNTNVTKELISSNGTLEISYEELESTNNTQKRFKRTLTVLNPTLESNDGISIRNEILVLGNDTIEADISIGFTGEIKNCTEAPPNTFTIYKLNEDRNKVITINFVNDFFDIIPLLENISEETPTKIVLNTTTNKITYKEFDSAIPENNIVESFCNNNIPLSINTTRKLIGNRGSIEISYVKLTPLDGKERFNRSYTLKDIILEGTGSPIQIDALLLDTEEIILK